MYRGSVLPFNNLSKRNDKMFMPYDDPVVKRKHQAQQDLLKKAGGNVNNYSQTIKDEVLNLRDKFPGKFPKASEKTKTF